MTGMGAAGYRKVLASLLALLDTATLDLKVIWKMETSRLTAKLVAHWSINIEIDNVNATTRGSLDDRSGGESLPSLFAHSESGN